MNKRKDTSSLIPRSAVGMTVDQIDRGLKKILFLELLKGIRSLVRGMKVGVV